MAINGDDARDMLAEIGEEILVADGFDEAIIGYVECAGRETVALYDRDKVLEILVSEGLTYEEAVEHFEFNTLGAYVGEYTPAFATIFREDDEDETGIRMPALPVGEIPGAE